PLLTDGHIAPGCGLKARVNSAENLEADTAKDGRWNRNNQRHIVYRRCCLVSVDILNDATCWSKTESHGYGHHQSMLDPSVSTDLSRTHILLNEMPGPRDDRKHGAHQGHTPNEVAIAEDHGNRIEGCIEPIRAAGDIYRERGHGLLLRSHHSIIGRCHEDRWIILDNRFHVRCSVFIVLPHLLVLLLRDLQEGVDIGHLILHEVRSRFLVLPIKSLACRQKHHVRVGHGQPICENRRYGRGYLRHCGLVVLYLAKKSQGRAVQTLKQLLLLLGEVAGAG